MFARPELLGLSADDLARHARVDVNAASRFLDIFSLPFGQAQIGDDRIGRYLIRERPLLQLPLGRYLAPLGFALVRAARSTIERELIRGDPKTWDRYEEGRAKLLERLTRELFAAMLPGAVVEGPLYYTFDDGDGARRYELDGLVLYGPVVFLLEGKAGELSAPARRGAPSVREDLTKLLGEAHEQALRALRYLRTAAQVEFEREDASRLAVRIDEHPERILVLATLETPQSFGVQASDLQDLGVLPSGAAPWAVSVVDLEAIAELIEWGPQLVHYLRRRLALHGQPVRALDELDLFGNYLRDGLYVVHSKAVSMVGNFSSILDPYFSRRHEGASPAAAMPFRMPISRKMREDIRAAATLPPNQAVPEVARLLEIALVPLRRAARRRSGV